MKRRKDPEDRSRAGKLGDVVVSVLDLSKKFCRGLRRSLVYGGIDIATELVGGRRRKALRKGEFWALKDVGFELRRGESLGLIGANGSGKTTLLRVLGGLIKPDTGSAEVRGLVAPLIALGAGFSPVLSGRENVYANLAILGLGRRQIEARFADVVEFAEIGDAIDAPVRTYSSGMAARLGFACAIHTDPDVFLVDEVLAVGDFRFRLKCFRKLAELRAQGTSLILVSHNPQIVLSTCDVALYLARGEQKRMGGVAEVLQAYEEDECGLAGSGAPGWLERPARSAEESPGLDVVSLGLRDDGGSAVEAMTTGEPASICIGVHAYREISQVSATVLVKERLGEDEWLLRLSTLSDGQFFRLDAGRHEIRLVLSPCILKAGDYSLKLNVAAGPDFVLDAVESFGFRVLGAPGMSQCQFLQPRRWEAIAAQEPKTTNPLRAEAADRFRVVSAGR